MANHMLGLATMMAKLEAKIERIDDPLEKSNQVVFVYKFIEQTGILISEIDTEVDKAIAKKNKGKALTKNF